MSTAFGPAKAGHYAYLNRAAEITPGRVVPLISMLLIVLTSIAGCSGSSTSPSARSKVTSSVGGGEFTLTTPVGMPMNGGCISINSISSPSLDWVFQMNPDHPTTIVVDATAFHDAASGCATSHLDTVPRPLVLMGPHMTYAPGETGTTTFSFMTERCKDGGRYGISVWALREESSETDADRVSSFTVVDCGFPSPPGIE